jgi:hypothetical protein
MRTGLLTFYKRPYIYKSNMYTYFFMRTGLLTFFVSSGGYYSEEDYDRNPPRPQPAQYEYPEYPGIIL